jgi:hypothetical protein
MTESFVNTCEKPRSTTERDLRLSDAIKRLAGVLSESDPLKMIELLSSAIKDIELAKDHLHKLMA